MINLSNFDYKDIKQLISFIPDARFLLQWAGPKYIYPLDASQLENTLAKTKGELPTFKVYKAVRDSTSETVGHIQLMDIDYHSSTCILGRVLIFPDFRGKGLASEMVRLAVDDAFNNLGLDEMTLGVFDFNSRAISTYKNVGFVKFEFQKAARQFQNEFWNVIKMKINKKGWELTRRC